ncbi:CHAT domain-containing protein [Pyrenochaeta sp. MPI-SDFR-AT-0127]|nr:CHAT domain-containing protein [Pyrenochaeta sp. MPI-SDFR-AT-0127]
MASPHVVPVFSSYRGLYTSLYKSLPAETIQSVEDAIWLKMKGQTADARAIFDNELRTAANYPIVIIERADLELEAGRWGVAWRLLDVALQNLKDSGADLDLPEHRLMTLTKVMLGVRHRGDLVSAVQEVERTSRWLCNVPVAEYTDVQTSCIRRYVIAYLFTRLSSNYQNPDVELIPKANDTESGDASAPWNGLHDLRRSLTSRGMFNEANALFRVELNRTPLESREPVIEEFLKAIVDFPTSSGRDLIESIVRLQWASSYVLVHDLPNAKAEIEKSESALNRWCAEFNVGDIYAVPTLHALICEKLNFIFDHAVKLEVAEAFIQILEKCGSSKTGSCLSTAAESAFALFQSTGKDEYLSKHFALHKRLVQFDEEETEDLCDLILHRNSLTTVTNKNMIDRQKSLEWITGFFKRYSYFASPAEIESLHRQRALLLRGLQRLEEAKEADDIADKLNAMGPSLGKWLNMSVINAIAPGSAAHSSLAADIEDEEGDFFYLAWLSAADDLNKIANIVVDFLLDWSFDDYLKGHLTIQDLQKIINIPEHHLSDVHGTDGAKRVKEIKANERGNLLSFLVPPDEKTELSQSDRWTSMADWLSNAPKGQKNKRSFCLLMLHHARQYYFSEKDFWSLRITETLQVLDLYAKIPEFMREITRTCFSSWLTALAFTYHAKLGGMPDLSDPAVYGLLLEAEKYNNMAIEELQSNYLQSSLANQQRLGAQICILKIRGLEQQLEQQSKSAYDSQQQEKVNDATAHRVSVAPEVVEEEITTLRNIGLEKIKKTEQIYTDSELESSWLDGIDGVEHRQRISQFHVSILTVHTAINLLLTGQQRTSQEAVNEVWRWVQKFKARSLARTIGMRSAIPPGLLKLILASDDARPIYEEMLDLLERIKVAQASAKFDLRKQFDAHRNVMRTHPLLRHLISLREGTPLEISDIAAIEAEAGRPIVLIDWFLLYSNVHDTVGKLLLFTARADSEPTMDVLAIKIQDVNRWQDDYLYPKELRDVGTRHKFDAIAGGLVAPLLNRTKENEILVFCPSVTLHRLPLHALSVSSGRGSEALIHRNPIVYTHSHSLLRSCFAAAETARQEPKTINAQFLSGIAGSDAKHYGAGRECVQDLAQRFNTAPLIDESASKKLFMSAVTQSRLLHLHTHCNWNFTDPLNHHVEFPRLEGAEEEILPKDRTLTAREIFDVSLLPGTHVNMIACQGGLTQVKPGDEVMGLVPALLYSGATSMVSTLWSIADRDGAAFSDLFFQSFVQQCMEPNIKREGLYFVDVAVALQEAVRELEAYDYKPLYGWAAFTLHGFWQFPISVTDVEKLRQEDE